AVVRILAAAMERAAAPEAARARRRAALSQGARQRHRARAQVLERAPALRRRAPPARPQAPAPHSEEPLSGSRHPALGTRAPSPAIQWRRPGLGPRPRYRRALPSVAGLTGSGAGMALRRPTEVAGRLVKVVSVNAGLPREVEWRGKMVLTSI